MQAASESAASIVGLEGAFRGQSLDLADHGIEGLRSPALTVRPLDGNGGDQLMERVRQCPRVGPAAVGRDHGVAKGDQDLQQGGHRRRLGTIEHITALASHIIRRPGRLCRGLGRETVVPNRVYALLVGINDYGPDIESLDGCLNDVDLVHEYLKRHVDPAALAVEVLKNGDATRANVIGRFRTHLGQAAIR